MTVQDVITHVAETRPHVYSDDVLCRWLSDLEGRIHNEIFQKQEDFKPIIAIEDDDRELLAYEPYTNIYSLYLYAQIEFANCETVKYANATAMFNSAYASFEADYIKKNRAKKNPTWNHLWG